MSNNLPYLPQRDAPRGMFLRTVARVWGWVDKSRRFVFNLLFLIVVVAVVLALFAGGKLKLQNDTVLVLSIDGPLVEQSSGGSARERALKLSQGTDTQQTQLRDVLAVLEAAAKDAKIKSVLLKLDNFDGAGLASLREVAAALQRFKASGKKLQVWGGAFDQSAYYLAAQADDVWLHPMGVVMMTGYGRTRNYYKDTLDRLGVTVHVAKVGTFKNAVEPYFANAPSAPSLEAEKYLWDGQWKTYTDGVEAARKLPAGSLMQGIDALPERFKAAGGSAAKLALQGKLVDKLMTRDEMRAVLIQNGTQDPQSKSFRQVGFSEYLGLVRAQQLAPVGDAVGVIVAEGEITDGAAPAGVIGGFSTAELVRKARDDKDIKAIVLRVNSPGGSAFGSELIRRELELTRAAGKPVVVSMGNLAASGGYWISMAADEIIADAATITGSIGVFGVLPSASGLLDKASVRTGGYHTTWLGNAFDPRLPLSDKFKDVVQASVQNIYDDFTVKAAAARKTTPQKIDEVAQGRVWTGAQAKDRGLIDRTGSFADAIASARSKAKLSDDARVSYIERDRSKLDLLIAQFSGAVASFAGASVAHAIQQRLQAMLPGAVVVGAAQALQVDHDLAWLAEMQSSAQRGMPFMAAAHCMCAP